MSEEKTKSRKLPDTSHAANKAATLEMRQGHYAKIIAALKHLGSGIYEEIADYIGMDRHQVGRRLSEMERMQIVWKPGGKKNTKSHRAAYTYQLTGDSQPKTDNQANAIEKALKGDSVGDISKKILQITKSIQLEVF